LFTDDDLSIQDNGYFPSYIVNKYSNKLGKYFTRFVKVAYCKFKLNSKNPVCQKIMEEWETVYHSKSDVKVLRSKNGKNKKVVYACSTPRKMFKLNETNMVYNQSSTTFNQTFYGTYTYFKKFYEKEVNERQEGKLLNYIKGHLNTTIETVQIFFVGHSYGGIICNILALRASELPEYSKFKQENSPVLITYGTPDIGGKTFSSATEKKIPRVFRIINKKDALPTYPRKTEFNSRINKKNITSIQLENIGNYIVLNPETNGYEMCPSQRLSKKSKCELMTNYSSANNMFYFNDNLANLSPKSEYNIAWMNGANIGANAYSALKPKRTNLNDQEEDS
jgi:hypothetical protein